MSDLESEMNQLQGMTKSILEAGPAIAQDNDVQLRLPNGAN